MRLLNEIPQILGSRITAALISLGMNRIVARTLAALQNVDEITSVKIENATSIADSFEKEKIYFCHGWNFDVMQRFGSFAYGFLVLKFPSIYQRFF